MSLKAVAFVSVKPGQEDAFAAAARTCIAASRAEPGMLGYDLWQKVDGERRFASDELYTEDAAFQAYLASRHFVALSEAAREFAAWEPTTTVTQPVDVAS